MNGQGLTTPSSPHCTVAPATARVARRSRTSTRAKAGGLARHARRRRSRGRSRRARRRCRPTERDGAHRARRSWSCSSTGAPVQPTKRQPAAGVAVRRIRTCARQKVPQDGRHVARCRDAQPFIVPQLVAASTRLQDVVAVEVCDLAGADDLRVDGQGCRRTPGRRASPRRRGHRARSRGDAGEDASSIGSIQQATGLDEPSGWHSVVTSGALRARIVRTFTAELAPGLETMTVISVPTLSCLLEHRREQQLAAVALELAVGLAGAAVTGT